MWSILPAQGQSIEAQPSSTEILLEEALTLDVVVKDMPVKMAPQTPQTDDFAIRLLNPSANRMEQVTIVNGRETRSISYTYRYELRPKREGSLTIPPFTLRRGKLRMETQPIPITVRRDTDGPYVFCKLTASDDNVYVGQAVDLTLEIWVRQFEQAGIGALSEESMWSLVQGNESRFGVFASTQPLDLRQVRTRRHKLDNGRQENFFVYPLKATVYPAAPGPLNLGEIRIVYNYPLRLRRDMFSLTLARARLLSVEAGAPDLTVKAIPMEGRPPDYNGAVGVFEMHTTAAPTQVRVGDPITLTLEIMGDRPMERLSPPRLEQVRDLASDFEVSSESLAGEIKGSPRGHRKDFSQTIRPLREDVTRIPAVPFSFFNPKTERFETTWSQPISISVGAAERLVIAAEDQPKQSPGQLRPLVESTEGLFRNFDDPEKVLTVQPSSIGPMQSGVLICLPLIYAAAWVGQRRCMRLRADQSLLRRGQALNNARRQLKLAEGNGAASHVRAALVGYVADKCGAPSEGMTAADAVGLLRRRGVPEETVDAMQSLLETVERSEYGGWEQAPRETWIDQARQVIGNLERCKLR